MCQNPGGWRRPTQLAGEDTVWCTRRRAILGLLVAGFVSAPVGWAVTDRLESDNDFCNACHLEPGLALHADVRRDFDAEEPKSLAGVHGIAPAVHREDAEFRCIDCHGGHSLVGRARVKVLAAKDAFWYVVGRFEEPDGMRWPLWDEDCAKCHDVFEEGEVADWQSPRFHQLPVHNVELGVGCVDCHLSHGGGGNPDAFFLLASRVRTRCALCHSEYENSEGGGS